MSSCHISPRQNARRGFTLVELLVVIVIIAILATLIFVGATAARNSVRRGIIKLQISQVSGALESYKNRFGEYPPDFSDEAAVMRHVRKRWPNWQNSPKNFGEFCDAILASRAGYNFKVLTSADLPGADSCELKSRGAHVGALAFWLGGIPDKSTGMLNGFSADVSNPLGVTFVNGKWNINDITQWDKDSQFIELTIGQNCEIVDGLPVITANGYPIAYFKPNAAGKYMEKAPLNESLCYHFRYNSSVHPPTWEQLGIAVPYAKTNAPAADAVWHNPKSYQLIHPGLDGKFSGENPAEFRAIDPANNVSLKMTLADRDNQANFGGTTIESAGN